MSAKKLQLIFIANLQITFALLRYVRSKLANSCEITFWEERQQAKLFLETQSPHVKLDLRYGEFATQPVQRTIYRESFYLEVFALW